MYTNTPQGYPGQGMPSSVDTAASSVMKRVYLKMTLGLLVTAFVSMFCAGSAAYLQFMFSNSWFMWVLFGAEFLIVIGMTGALTRMSSAAAAALFYIFAIINGMSLAPIFIIYTGASIAKTFFITAGTFAGMSLYGYTTKSDLTKFGSILFMALIGLIIASVVNIFAHSDTLSWIISVAGVLIFVGLTAWDTQKIKQWSQVATPAQYGHLSTIGALSLYLDFINLFLYLLRFFGNSRD